MSKTKNLSLISFILLLVIGSFIVPFAVADTSTITASYAFVNNDLTGWGISRSYPNAGDTHVSALSMSFDPSVAGYLEAIILSFKLTGSPVANVTMELRECTDNNIANLGTTIVATSTTTLSTSLLSSAEWRQVTFQFNRTLSIDASKYYRWYIYVIGSTVDGSNYVMVAGDFDSVNYGGYSSRYGAPTTDDWETPVTPDVCFIVIVSDTAAPTATPTPTPSPTPEAMPNWISDIIDAIIPIFTPLLVIFICGALGWRFAGAWGFFAGINLAIVLMYIVAPQYMPLWAIVAVVMVDVGLLFGKVGYNRN